MIVIYPKETKEIDNNTLTLIYKITGSQDIKYTFWNVLPEVFKTTFFQNVSCIPGQEESPYSTNVVPDSDLVDFRYSKRECKKGVYSTCFTYFQNGQAQCLEILQPLGKANFEVKQPTAFDY